MVKASPFPRTETDVVLVLLCVIESNNPTLLTKYLISEV
jgi:hypothetical protein